MQERLDTWLANLLADPTLTPPERELIERQIAFLGGQNEVPSIVLRDGADG